MNKQVFQFLIGQFFYLLELGSFVRRRMGNHKLIFTFLNHLEPVYLVKSLQTSNEFTVLFHRGDDLSWHLVMIDAKCQVDLIRLGPYRLDRLNLTNRFVTVPATGASLIPPFKICPFL